MGNSEDADWQLAADGDAAAFARVYDLHADRVFRYAYRLVGSAEDARDVAAASFMEAWRKRKSVRVVDGSILGWLLVTTMNMARNANRSIRRYQSLLAHLSRTVEAHEPWRSEDLHMELVRAIGGLKPPYRDVVALCLVEGFSEQDASKFLEVPVGTVKSRLSRARAQLQNVLESEIHLSNRRSAAEMSES